MADNAIYHLIRAVDRISRFEFPVQLNDANRGYLTGIATIVSAEKGAAMRAAVNDPHDRLAVAILDKDPNWHAMLRTACVATTLDAGHATSALPQRARANINCRIFPGGTTETIKRQLEALVADPKVSVAIPEVRGPVAVPAPLTPAILDPVRRVAADL